MKINLEVDLSPEEARRILGLPDLEPVQQRIIAELESRMMGYLSAIEPESIMKIWLPMGLQGFEKFQDMLWNVASRATRAGRKDESDK